MGLYSLIRRILWQSGLSHVGKTTPNRLVRHARVQMQMAQMQMGGGARPPPPAMPGAHAMKSNVMSGNSSGASAGFSFLDNKNAASDAKKKQNEAFNFVADDMKKG